MVPTTHTLRRKPNGGLVAAPELFTMVQTLLYQPFGTEFNSRPRGNNSLTKEYQYGWNLAEVQIF